MADSYQLGRTEDFQALEVLLLGALAGRKAEWMVGTERVKYLQYHEMAELICRSIGTLSDNQMQNLLWNLCSDLIEKGLMAYQACSDGKFDMCRITDEGVCLLQSLTDSPRQPIGFASEIAI